MTVDRARMTEPPVDGVGGRGAPGFARLGLGAAGRFVDQVLAAGAAQVVDGVVVVDGSQASLAEFVGVSAGTVAKYLRVLERAGLLVSRRPLQISVPSASSPATARGTGAAAGSVRPSRLAGQAADAPDSVGARRGGVGETVGVLAGLVKRHAGEPTVVAALADAIAAVAVVESGWAAGSAGVGSAPSVRGSAPTVGRGSVEETDGLTDGDSAAGRSVGLSHVGRGAAPAGGADPRGGDDGAFDKAGVVPADGTASIGNDGGDVVEGVADGGGSDAGEWAGQVALWEAAVVDAVVVSGRNGHRPARLWERLRRRFSVAEIGAAVDRVVGQTVDGDVRAPFVLLESCLSDSARAREYFRDPAEPVSARQPVSGASAPSTPTAAAAVVWEEEVDGDGVVRVRVRDVSTGLGRES